MDLASSGGLMRERRSIIDAVARQALTIQVTTDADRPYLLTTATVIVAALGTVPGQGFVSAAQATSGAATFDGPSNWAASTRFDLGTSPTSQTLTFTPKAAGVHPVYVIERAVSTAATPSLCGETPDKGDDGQNVIGWIQVP